MAGFKEFLVIFHVLLIVLKSDGIEVLDLDFPEGFLIGTASSAYQVEGAWNVGDKSESNWDHYVHNHPAEIADCSAADITSDFYHHYKEDIKLIKRIGFKFYRFSMSWTRILPSGKPDVVSKEGLKFYHNILDELEKEGIEPFVTIYHWDHPQKFEDQFGGWLSEKMAYMYHEYAKVVFKEFAHRVKVFSTINEPHIFCNSAYTTRSYPPGPEKNITDWGEYHCIQNILKGHALAYHTYDDEYRQTYDGKIGIVMPIMYPFSKDPADKVSTDVNFEFQCGLTANPIYSKKGDYPEIVKKRVADRSKAQGLKESRLPKLSKYWIKYIRGTADYFGLNHYTSSIVEPLPSTDILTWPNDEGLLITKDSRWATAQSPWLKIVPEGFSATLRKIKEKYDNPPVYIMENGVSDGNSTNDDMRISYMRSYMKEMLMAIKRDKCNVKAYSVWSFTDSFEWDAGFTQKFGIIEVDFNDKDRKRTPKKSASWIQEVIQANKLM